MRVSSRGVSPARASVLSAMSPIVLLLSSIVLSIASGIAARYGSTSKMPIIAMSSCSMLWQWNT